MSESSEDEIFIGPIVSEKEKKLIKKRGGRKTEVFHPNFREEWLSLGDDDEQGDIQTENCSKVCPASDISVSVCFSESATSTECADLSEQQNVLINKLKAVILSDEDEHSSDLPIKLDSDLTDGCVIYETELTKCQKTPEIVTSMLKLDKSSSNENLMQISNDDVQSIKLVTEIDEESFEDELADENLMHISTAEMAVDDEFQCCIRNSIQPSIKHEIFQLSEGLGRDEKENVIPIESNCTPIKRDFVSDVESSPEADFFDFGFDQLPANSPLVEALNISPPVAPKRRKSSICHLDLSIRDDWVKLEDISNKETLFCDSTSPPIGLPVGVLEQSKPSMRKPKIFWSPRPNESFECKTASMVKQASHIPVFNVPGVRKPSQSARKAPIVGSNISRYTATGTKLSNPKKWKIVSPVARYIQEQPPPPLIRTIRGVKQISRLQSPIAVKSENIRPVASPSIGKLPAAEYQISGRKIKEKHWDMLTNLHTAKNSTKVQSFFPAPYQPTVIRHTGPSKALQWATHLANDESNCASPDTSILTPTRKPILIARQVHPLARPELDPINLEKSVAEFVNTQRTNTLH